MAGESLGEIPCAACDTTANIKKRSNSKMLYIHCPNCGLDQRSGHKMQTMLHNIINGAQEQESPAIESETEAKTVSEKEQKQAEWTPTREEPENAPPEQNAAAFKWVMGTLLTVAALAGGLVKMSAKK